MHRWIQRFILLVGVVLFQAVAAHAAATDAAQGHGLQGVLIEITGTAIVVGVFLYTVKCFLWPGEKDNRHIKRRILRDHW